MSIKIGLLGPEGSFTHQALLKYLKTYHLRKKVEIISIDMNNKLLDAQTFNKIDKALIPMGDTLQGRIEKNFDYLFEQRLFVNCEVKLPVRLMLAVPPKSDNIKKIYATSEAFQYALKHIKELSGKQSTRIKTVEVKTEQEGLKYLRRTNTSAVIISPSSAKKDSSIKIMNDNFVDKRGKREVIISFYLVSKNPEVPKKEKGKKYHTLIAITPNTDRPGLLRDISSIISIYNVNMTDIFSRPAIEPLAETDESKMFYIIMEGHIMSDIFQTHILEGIRSILQHNEEQKSFHFLGCYETC